MIELFSLGEIYISDFLRDGEEPRGGKHELKLVMEEDDSRAIRLETVAPLNTLFGEYWYRSGINPKMVNELKSIVDSILPLMKFKENSVWLDIACNDGTLLSFVPNNFIKIGIDPADDSFKNESEKYANEVIQDFFSVKSYKSSKYGTQKAKVITAIAMFYDIEDQDAFLQDINEVMDNEGLLVMQLSHAGLMMKQLAFDNILSEHVYYLTLSSMAHILARNRLYVSDCQLNDTNGGSFRLYIRKWNSNPKLFATQQYRDVCDYRKSGLVMLEGFYNLNKPDRWKTFFEDIERLKGMVCHFIKLKKEEGKTIWAYAASTKGNTLLQYFNLDNTIIDGIAERSSFKWGLRTVGSNIKIYSEDDMRKAKPDYVLILAWHFVDSFIEREKDYLDAGGKFIVCMPKFEIIEK